MHRTMLRSSIVITVIACVVLLIGTTGSAQVINEYLANHTGNDDHEYIEIFGLPNTSYANLTIVQIEGDVGDGPGNLDSAITVGTTDGDGYWWTGYLNNELHNANS